MSFYDVNEDPAAQQKQWRLKLTSVVDISVTDEFSVDAATKRFTLDTAAIALEFPSFKALQMFQTEYVYKLFENTWGMYSDKQRDQVRLQHDVQHSVRLSCVQHVILFCVCLSVCVRAPVINTLFCLCLLTM